MGGQARRRLILGVLGGALSVALWPLTGSAFANVEVGQRVENVELADPRRTPGDAPVRKGARQRPRLLPARPRTVARHAEGDGRLREGVHREAGALGGHRLRQPRARRAEGVRGRVGHPHAGPARRGGRPLRQAGRAVAPGDRHRRRDGGAARLRAVPPDQLLRHDPGADPLRAARGGPGGGRAGGPAAEGPLPQRGAGRRGGAAREARGDVPGIQAVDQGRRAGAHRDGEGARAGRGPRPPGPGAFRAGEVPAGPARLRPGR